MSHAHDDFLAAGVRLFGISVDSPQQHSAMVEKLDLAFPLLSDPDRSAAIEPLGVPDEKDPRGIARPATILVTSEGEAWRFVSRDFADRLPEDEVLGHARDLGLDATTQEPPTTTDPQPGENAMPLEGLPFYFRGARFAALAMGLRHKDLGDDLKDDSKAYVAEMDRYLEALEALQERRA